MQHGNRLPSRGETVNDPSEQPEPPPREPATSFKWVIVAGVTVWVLGALMIVWSRFLAQ